MGQAASRTSKITRMPCFRQSRARSGQALVPAVGQPARFAAGLTPASKNVPRWLGCGGGVIRRACREGMTFHPISSDNVPCYVHIRRALSDVSRYNQRMTMATSAPIPTRLGPHCRALRRGVIGDAIDGRSREGKFLRKCEAELVAQVGGQPSFAQRLLIRRIARAMLKLELFDAKMAGGLLDGSRRLDLRRAFECPPTDAA